MKPIFLVVFAALSFAAAARMPAAEATPGPVKVFILAGQSNMEGQGKIAADPERNGGKGSLEYLVNDPATASRFRHVVDEDGNWVVRNDVWIWYLGRSGGLTVGYGARADRIGPEFQFGHVVGDYLDDQVLLIKTAWGGKSLVKDFRPPSSGGEVGLYYTQMIRHVREVLANLEALFPAYQGQGYEIAGFGWHQGWNDGWKMEAVNQYEENLVHLIRDLRQELGARNLPVVIANSGFGGWDQKIDRRLGIVNAQLGVANRPELAGTVLTVETRGFFRPAEVSPSRQGYHWNGNAETYFLIGDCMGQAMKRLLASAAGSRLK
ncbi:MAG: sialate O-acetylesterase [Planctomycetota bacterium]|jgi:alpha-galactosidase